MRKGMFGRIPLWGKVVPIIALAAGITAAVAGSGVMGDNLVKVQDPITVEAVDAGSAGVTYNDNLSFEVTAETYPGETYDLEIDVKNHTSVDQTHRIVLEYPDGFRFDRTVGSQGSAITLTQEDPNSFVFTATSSADGTSGTSKVVIEVEVLPQVLPGWYTISGATEALETDLSNVG